MRALTLISFVIFTQLSIGVEFRSGIKVKEGEKCEDIHNVKQVCFSKDLDFVSCRKPNSKEMLTSKALFVNCSNKKSTNIPSIASIAQSISTPESYSTKYNNCKEIAAKYQSTKSSCELSYYKWTAYNKCFGADNVKYRNDYCPLGCPGMPDYDVCDWTSGQFKIYKNCTSQNNSAANLRMSLCPKGNKDVTIDGPPPRLKIIGTRVPHQPHYLTYAPKFRVYIGSIYGNKGIEVCVKTSSTDSCKNKWKSISKGVNGGTSTFVIRDMNSGIDYQKYMNFPEGQFFIVVKNKHTGRTSRLSLVKYGEGILGKPKVVDKDGNIESEATTVSGGGGGFAGHDLYARKSNVTEYKTTSEDSEKVFVYTIPEYTCQARPSDSIAVWSELIGPEMSPVSAPNSQPSSNYFAKSCFCIGEEIKDISLRRWKCVAIKTSTASSDPTKDDATDSSKYMDEQYWKTPTHFDYPSSYKFTKSSHYCNPTGSQNITKYTCETGGPTSAGYYSSPLTIDGVSLQDCNKTETSLSCFDSTNESSFVYYNPDSTISASISYCSAKSTDDLFVNCMKNKGLTSSAIVSKAQVIPFNGKSNLLKYEFTTKYVKSLSEEINKKANFYQKWINFKQTHIDVIKAFPKALGNLNDLTYEKIRNLMDAMYLRNSGGKTLLSYSDKDALYTDYNKVESFYTANSGGNVSMDADSDSSTYLTQDTSGLVYSTVDYSTIDEGTYESKLNTTPTCTYDPGFDANLEELHCNANNQRYRLARCEVGASPPLMTGQPNYDPNNPWEKYIQESTYIQVYKESSCNIQVIMAETTEVTNAELAEEKETLVYEYYDNSNLDEPNIFEKYIIDPFVSGIENLFSSVEDSFTNYDEPEVYNYNTYCFYGHDEILYDSDCNNIGYDDSFYWEHDGGGDGPDGGAGDSGW